MKINSRISAGIVGSVAVAASAVMLMVGAGSALAAAPPFEPDPSSVGTITFYDSSGNVVTSGSTDTAPLAAYAVGSTAVRAGDVSAVLQFANPDPNALIPLWHRDQVGAFTPYPMTTGPANVQALSQTHPVNAGDPSDETLDDFRSNLASPSTQAGYANTVQVRLITANPAGAQTTTYDDADVLIDPATHTWTQVYPTVQTATSTTLTAAPSPATVGDTVTLTATETPASAGSVQFEDGATAVGSPVAVNASGVATTTTATLGQGSHNLSAVFTPTDNSFAASTGTATEVVNPAATPTHTALAVVQDGQAGDDATLTASVTGPGSTPNNAGTVSFFDNSSTTPLNATPVTGTAGVYSLDLPTGFAAGSHSIVAKFAPTDLATFEVSQSAPQGFLTQAPVTGACQDPASHCSDTQNLQVTVPTGTLVINTPYTPTSPLDLGTMALNSTGTEFTANAPFQNIVVTDTRSGIGGVNAYTVSAIASPLSDGASNPGSTINAQNVGLTGVSVTPGAGFAGSTVTTDNPAADPALAPTAAGNVGLGGTAKTVFTASNSTGTVTANGTVTINAPTSTEAGIFTGTITFTVG